jgi:hypothetical protein
MSIQRFPPEFKEEAVRQIVERGYSVAEGFHCESSCMGENHGGGHPGGRWYEVSETFAVSWSVQRYSCRHLRVKKTGGRS